MTVRFESTIDIDASPEIVWGVLADLAAYGEWNPYIVDVRGTLEEGAALELTISPPDHPTFTTGTLVSEVRPPRQLALTWVTDDPDLFSGGAHYEIEPLGTGVQVTFVQTMVGEPGLRRRGLGDRNDLALEMMLAALRGRAERLSHL